MISNSLVRKDVDLNNQLLQRVTDLFAHKFDLSYQLVEQLYQDDYYFTELRYYLSHSSVENYEYRLRFYEESRSFSPRSFEIFLSSYMDINNEIVNISLYNPVQKEFYHYNRMGRTRTAERPISKGDPLKPQARIGMLAESEILLNNESFRIFSFVIPLKDPNSNENFGAIIFDILSSSVTSEIESFGDFFNGFFIVADVEERLLFSSREGVDHRAVIANPQISEVLKGVGASVYGVIDRDQLKDNLAPVRNTFLLFIILNLGIIAMVGIYISRYFQSRITPIIKAMGKLKEGDLDVRIRERRDDELGQIARSFDTMAEDLKEYIHKVYVLEMKQQHTELEMLQNQINPHFLSNTLEAIRMKALADSSSSTAEMIYILSRLFRRTVKTGSSVVTLAEELESLREYGRLFQIRYGESFLVEEDLAPAVLSRGIMKFLLQPLLENYISHGLESGRQTRLVIRAREVKDTLIIEFIDDGRGIPADKLREIRTKLARHNLEELRSIGLVNVHERIRIAFGGDYGLAVESREEGGTHVTLSMPALTKKELSDLV